MWPRCAPGSSASRTRRFERFAVSSDMDVARAPTRPSGKGFGVIWRRVRVQPKERSGVCGVCPVCVPTCSGCRLRPFGSVRCRVERLTTKSPWAQDRRALAGPGLRLASGVSWNLLERKAVEPTNHPAERAPRNGGCGAKSNSAATQPGARLPTGFAVSRASHGRAGGYAAMPCAVGERTREIRVRIAPGAPSPVVLRLVIPKRRGSPPQERLRGPPPHWRAPALRATCCTV